MLGFMCLFLPPVLMAYMWNRLVCSAKSLNMWVRNYIFSFLYLNGLTISVVTFVFKHTEDLVYKLNKYNSFALKYILCSLLFAALTIGVKIYLLQRFRLEISVSGIRPFQHWHTVAVIYAFLLFLLNFILIFDSNFWGDETYSIMLVKRSIYSIINGAANDVHPPLYYLILKLVCSLAGYKGSVYHFASLLPYMILMGLSLTYIWKHYGKETSFILMTMISLMPNAIVYNMEVRMYSLGFLFVLVSYLFLEKVLVENRITSWIGFILFSLAAAYTHYFCLISVSFFYLAIIIAALVRRKDFFKKTMIACLVTVIGYFPWFLVLLKTVSRVSKDFWITEWNLPNWDECMNYIFNGRFCRLLLWVWIFSIIIFVLYETNIIRVKKQGECCILRFEISEVRKTKTLLWVFAGLASVFGTVLIGLLVSEFMRPIFVLRYMYPVTAVAYFLLTYCISKCKLGGEVLSFLLIAMLLFSCVPAYINTYVSWRNQEVSSQETLAATSEIDQDSIIWTDVGDISGTVSKYYYPGVKCRLVDLDVLPDFEEGKTNWIFSSSKLDVSTFKKGYDLEEIVNGGILGTHWIYVYRLGI